MAEEAKKVAAAPAQTYYVKNVVRRVGSRLHRAKSASRHRFKLFIGARRLLRNKKLPLSPEEFEVHKDQIKQMVLDGQVALYLPDGLRVTSLPDGRLVYTKPNGAMKVDETPQPVPEGKTVPAAPQKMAAPPPPPPKEEEVKEEVEEEVKVEDVVEVKEEVKVDTKSKRRGRKKD
jgi:hypothetical protein